MREKDFGRHIAWHTEHTVQIKLIPQYLSLGVHERTAYVLECDKCERARNSQNESGGGGVERIKFRY